MHNPPIRHCTACGSPVTYRVPEGDSRPRAVCPACGHIQYENPRNIVGTIPTWGLQVLLCRRAIEPRYGYWTLPAGFMENGETTAEGAQRETVEEAGARIALGEPFSMIDVPHVNQVHVFFLAEMLDAALDPGPESLEAQLFVEADIPWEAIAFRTVEQTLRWYFADRARGTFSMHVGAFRQRPPRTN